MVRSWCGSELFQRVLKLCRDYAQRAAKCGLSKTIIRILNRTDRRISLWQNMASFERETE